MKIYFHGNDIEIDDSLYEKATLVSCHFTQTEIDEFCVRGTEDMSGMVDTRGEPGFSISDIMVSSTLDEITQYVSRGIELMLDEHEKKAGE